jgi:type VI secretion system protein ImpG
MPGLLEALLPYYESELGALRELGGEFARQYPKIASRLQIEGDQCEDPHVERIIESFAFLTSRIRRKLDDDYPEIAASLLEVLYPHYLCPFPSCAVVQFVPNTGGDSGIKGRHTIGRLREVKAPTNGGVQCQFRTCYPVDIFPLSLTHARLELTSGSAWLRQLAPDAAAVLTLKLETPPGTAISEIGLKSLRFFLDGEPALMCLLHEVMVSDTLRVRTGDGSDMPDRTAVLPKSCLAAVGFGADEGLLDYGDRSFLGYRLLSEYFAFPEKFLFVDFLGLDKITPKINSNTLVIQCLIGRYADTGRHQRLMETLSPRYFKLGCTPTINLFTRMADPINVTHLHDSYPLYPDSRQLANFEVVQVKSVMRVEKTDLEEQVGEVPPFYSVSHGGEPARFYWHATRETSPRQDDKGTDVSLHLVDLNFEPTRPGGEVLSVEVLCSNRDLPEHIPFGGGESGQHSDFNLEEDPVIKRVRLLRKPTPCYRPQLGRGLQWRLVSHLSLNYLSLVEGGHTALQEMLSLYDFAQSSAVRRQIQGITAIDSRPAVARVNGPNFSCFVRGTDISLTLDEDYYVGGSAYLLASVLERFFALYCAPNSFTRLTVHNTQGTELFAWPARSGSSLVV